MHHTHHPHRNPGSQRAFTLLETLVVVTIITVISGAAIPRIHNLFDATAVREATNEAGAMLELARHVAMARGDRTTVDIDSAPARLTLRTGDDTLDRLDEQAAHGVHFTANRPSVVYSQLGLGFGVSNVTLIISRGAIADTLVVSRLGRVRR